MGAPAQDGPEHLGEPVQAIAGDDPAPVIHQLYTTSICLGLSTTIRLIMIGLPPRFFWTTPLSRMVQPWAG